MAAILCPEICVTCPDWIGLIIPQNCPILSRENVLDLCRNGSRFLNDITPTQEPRAPNLNHSYLAVLAGRGEVTQQKTGSLQSPGLGKGLAGHSGDAANLRTAKGSQHTQEWPEMSHLGSLVQMALKGNSNHKVLVAQKHAQVAQRQGTIWGQVRSSKKEK